MKLKAFLSLSLLFVTWSLVPRKKKYVPIKQR